MTLARQLILCTALVLVVGMTGSTIINVLSTKSYVTRQLETHARDAATSLAMSISLHLAEGDSLIAESMVDAMFDSGYYRRIEVSAGDRMPAIRRIAQQRFDDVPQWFVDALPIIVGQASAELTEGWQIVGAVRVHSHPGHAYRALWRSTVNDLEWTIALTLGGFVFLYGLIKWLLRPLREIEAQALAVASRVFPKLERLPRTRELRRVAESMELMTRRVEQMLDEHVNQAQRLEAELYEDPVTGFRNRRGVERALEELVRSRRDLSAGALMIVSGDQLDAINRSGGYEAGDAYVRMLADSIWSCVPERGATLGRLGGARLALILPEATRAAAVETAAAIVSQLNLCSADLGVDLETTQVGVRVGGALCTGVQSAEELQGQAEAALRNAELDSNVGWHLFAASETVEPATLNESEQWQILLNSVIASGEVILAAQEVRDLTSGEPLHIELLARFEGADGTLVPAGVLVPVAASQGLSAALDMVIVNALLDVVGQRSERFAVNLSAGSIADASFIAWLISRLRDLPRTQRERIAFETTEYAALTHPQSLQTLADGVHGLGVRFGLDHCGAADVSLKPLQHPGIDYAKLYGGLIQGLDQNRDQRELVRSLVSLGHGLDVLMIAEHIETDAELQMARSLGLDAAQGYFLGKPEPLSARSEEAEPNAQAQMR